MPRAKKKSRISARLIRKHIRTLALGKSKYKEADAALSAVLDSLPRCESCGGIVTKDAVAKLAGGKKFRIVDKLSEKYSTAVGQNARRFEVEEVEQV